jgi:hypothetical protein
MSMTKPKKASLLSTCPHLAVAYEGGGNWGWVYYDSYQKAKEVADWIKSGYNSKFSCAGRCDLDEAGTETKSLLTLWCVHYHYDNTNRPASIQNCPNIRTLWK